MLRRKTRRVVLILLLVGVPLGLYYLQSWLAEFGPSPEASEWLLLALSLALVVLTLGLAGVLIRNLVKLIVDRKRGVLGSKLRIKLVFFFLALVLVPAVVLFSGSATVIKQTVEAILRTPLEHLTRGREIVDEWTDFFRAQSLRRAGALAEEIRESDLLDADRRGELERLLERRQQQEQLLVILVRSSRGWVARAEEGLVPELRTELTRLIEGVVEESLRESRPVGRIGNLGEGLLAHAAVPLDPAPANDGSVVAVGLLLPAPIAGNAARIDAAVQDYRQFRTQRRHLVRFYVTLIGLIFLATLFVATWIGLYVSRRITDPIQEVAAASREIAAGNLDVRVRANIGDEMGALVDSFNEMAGELQENRAVITRSTADLRRSNRALDDRRRYIETLVANLSTAVISLDPQGRVSTVNPAVQKILGVPLTVGEDARDQLLRHGLEPLAELLGSRKQSVRRDLELPGKAATQHVAVQISPLESRSDDEIGTLIMVEDLTDLLRAQKAQAWQEVARRIAHEIKNPLTPIQLAAQRLRKKFFAKADDLDQVLLDATDSIEHEVGGLKQLVDEFSRFARMPEVRPDQVEFRQVVESVLSLYAGLPDIRWEVELDPQVGWVRVDSRQMRRALINLIDNAVAAVNGKGTIRILTRTAGADGSLHIEVSDTGPGIPPGDRDKMFVPYFSTKKRGTGLGLAIVHKVVTDHQGTIRVEDNSPSGARFVIDIPCS